MGNILNGYRSLYGKPEDKRPLRSLSVGGSDVA